MAPISESEKMNSKQGELRVKLWKTVFAFEQMFRCEVCFHGLVGILYPS